MKKGNLGEMPLSSGGSVFDNVAIHQGERSLIQGTNEMSSPRKPGEGLGSALQKEERRNQ